MSSVQAKKSPARRSAPVHVTGRSDRSDGGLHAVETEAAQTSQLSAFYHAGPAVPLGRTGGGVQLKQDIASPETSGDIEPMQHLSEREKGENSTERADALQACACEKEQQDIVEPARVQRKEELDESQQDAVQSETVQFWDCRKYEKPTCVQTKGAPFEEVGGQKKCADCAAEEQVQSKCTTCQEDKQVQGVGVRTRNPHKIQRQARIGLKDASAPLPHGERIQAAFGRHNLTQVRASIGGNARNANRRMGALAYTSGDRISFRDAPSLHLAAHEAAHVVQQREGLRLPDNVGQPEDRWERHADQVADLVVKGKSAEGLLNEVAGSGMQATSLPDANGEVSAAPPGNAVQQQITSCSTRMFESPPLPQKVTAQPQEGSSETEETKTEMPESETGEGEAEVLEAAREGEDEAPTEGTSAQGTGSDVAGPGAGAAPATGESAPAPGPAIPAEPSAATDINDPASEAGSGGGINAPCYNVVPPPHPDNTPNPASDNQGAESEVQPQVTFEAWPDEADQCPVANTVTEGNRQISACLGMDGGSTVVEATSISGSTIAEGASAGGAGTSSREVQAMSRAAATSVDQSALATSPMDGPIANAETERDAAISRYLASGDKLKRVVSRSSALASGVTFPAATNLKQFQARQAAMATTRDFLARATGQIAVAVAYAQGEVPAMLGAAAESVKAGIQAAIETEKSVISDRVAQARVLARNDAAIARTHINSEHAINAAQIEAATLDAISALDTAHATSLEQVDEKEKSGLDNVNSRFAVGRTQHEAKGPQYAGRAIARGQEHVDAYERCKRHPKTSVNYDDDGFWDGCLTVRRAKAQQDAACKTAAGYRDTFLRIANQKGYDLIALRRQYRCAAIAGAGQVNQTLDDTHERLVSGLESGRTQAMDGIAQARDQNLAAVDAALEATLQSLSAQEHTQRQSVNDTGYLKQLAAEQLAHAGAASLANGISAAADSLEQTLTTLRERFAHGDIPDPASLAESLAVTEAALGRGMGSLLDKMAEGAQQAEMRIVDLSASALEALLLATIQNDELSSQVETSFTQQMDGLKSAASSTIGQLARNHVQQAEQAMTEGTASMEQAVAGFDEALATIGGRIDEAISASLQELDQQLRDKLRELDGQITREAWKAAKKEQPAWKGVAAIVLIIVVIIAAALISIATLGAGASLFAVILVGALVGAVSGGLIQLINNWASGEAWHTGLVQAMVMGAIGGAIGGGLGFAGGALAGGAAAAGAGRMAQFAITLGMDMVSEAITQVVGYFAFGQKFNWQGFVMAGAMSGVSFRAHPSGTGAAVPRAAGAAGGRRAAVAQIAGGAALGLGIEYATAKISGQEFDITKAASAAASAAVSARMSRRAASTEPRPEPTTRLERAAARIRASFEPTTRVGSALERFRTVDPGGVGARVETRLKELGGQVFGARPEAEVPANARPRVEETVGRPVTEPEAVRLGVPEEPAATTRLQLGETEAVSGRRSVEELETVSSQRPINETAAELAGPANRINEQDLIDATKTRARVGDTEHDFYVSRRGCEICSNACGPTNQRLTEMIDALPNGTLRRRLERLRGTVEEVKVRLANGESGVNMIRDTGRIASEFRVLSKIHPSLGRSLETPQLRQTRIEGPKAATMTSLHLSELNVDVTLARAIKPSDWKSIKLNPGEDAVYIVRDSASGSILKVGCAGPTCGGSTDLNRFTQYANAGNKLGLNLEVDVAVVRTRSGERILDVEKRLHNRVQSEGNILPWESTGGRLGRQGRGIPFVHPSQKNLMWDADANLVVKGSGAHPIQPAIQPRPSPEELANLINQGQSVKQIAEARGVHESTVYRWRQADRRVR